jgi:hypothetical protein
VHAPRRRQATPSSTEPPLIHSLDSHHPLEGAPSSRYVRALHLSFDGFSDASRACVHCMSRLGRSFARTPSTVRSSYY